MLVNLTPDLQEIERRKQIAIEHKFEYVPQSDTSWLQETGIYQSSFPYNFPEIEFEEFKGMCNIPREQSYEMFKPTYHKNSYGVADSIEQIKEYYKEEIEDAEKKYFIVLTPVFQEKENKGKGGGWRWHKWGEYIGKLDTRCEYLDDEEFGDDFKYVICFSIYLVL
jgi:hypothetical protein